MKPACRSEAERVLGATHTLAPGPGAAAVREPERRLSRAYLNCGRRAGPGGAASRAAVALRAAVRAPGASRTMRAGRRARRPWGVTSPLSLIRRAACAARRRGHDSPDPHGSADTGTDALWVPGSQCWSGGPDPHPPTRLPKALGVKFDPPPTGSGNLSCSFKVLSTHPDSCVNFCEYILLHLFWGFWGRQERKRSWVF